MPRGKFIGRTPVSFGAKAKRRSESQRVGKRGQLLFESWAVEQSLIANPCPDDFGIDYFCQVVQPVRHSASEELRGDSLLVQVRSVKGGRRPRVVLNKQDAETALRAEQPYALVGVHVERRKIYFRFLDQGFADQLASFIAAPQTELTLRIDGPQFSSTKFRRLLDHHCSSGVQQRLRIRCLELCLRREIPGARIRVTQRVDSGLVLVDVPSIGSALHARKGQEEVLARHVFESGNLPPLGAGITLRPMLFKAMEMHGAEELIVTGGIEARVDGYIEAEGKRELFSFRTRRAGNTMAYISECGLVLTVSEPVKRGKRFAHQLGMRFSSEFGRTLDKFAEFDRALRLLGANAKIGFSETSRGVNVSNWGQPLVELGAAYKQILEAFDFAGLSLGITQLKDLENEEFMASVAVLSALARRASVHHFLPGFLLGPAVEDKQYREKLCPCGFEIPVVMNVKSRGLAVWLHGKGKAYVHAGGLICGLVAEELDHVRVAVMDDRLEKAFKTPEVWVASDWPSIPLLQELSERASWRVGAAHAISGRVWTL